MFIKPINSRPVAAVMIALFLAVSVWVPVSQANMIGTEAVVEQESAEQTRGDVLDLLARDDVRDQLVSWGVDPEDAENRVQAMTADELETLQEQMGDEPAGAGASSVVSAALIVFLVLLITDILGYTNVFPFVERTAQ